MRWGLGPALRPRRGACGGAAPVSGPRCSGGTEEKGREAGRDRAGQAPAAASARWAPLGRQGQPRGVPQRVPPRGPLTAARGTPGLVVPLPARAVQPPGDGTSSPTVPRAAPLAAQPAGSSSPPPALHTGRGASGDCISRRAPRRGGPPGPSESPQRGESRRPFLRRRPLLAAAPPPPRGSGAVTDVDGEALGVLQVAEDLVGRQGDALVQTAVPAAPSPAPLRHFERSPLLAGGSFGMQMYAHRFAWQ